MDGRAVNCWDDTDTLQECHGAAVRHGAAGLVTSICTPSDTQRTCVRKWHITNPKCQKEARGNSGSKHFLGRETRYFSRISFVLLQKRAVLVPRQGSNIHLGSTCWLPSSNEGWPSLGTSSHLSPHSHSWWPSVPETPLDLRALACPRCGSQKAAAFRI